MFWCLWWLRRCFHRLLFFRSNNFTIDNNCTRILRFFNHLLFSLKSSLLLLTILPLSSFDLRFLLLFQSTSKCSNFFVNFVDVLVYEEIVWMCNTNCLRRIRITTWEMIKLALFIFFWLSFVWFWFWRVLREENRESRCERESIIET